MRRLLIMSVLFSLGALFAASVARAEIYRFVDEHGVVHFSNIPDDPRYKPVDETAKKKKKKKKKASTAQKAQPKAPKKVRMARRNLDDYDDNIAEASLRFSIPAPLIRAVIAVESNFNSKAISHAGAQGLMQLMPATAVEMGVDDVFDPRQNILGGTRYLRLLANMFEGDLVLTLAGYNAGQNAVNKHGDIPPYAETQRYVRRVLQLYYHYKKQEQ